MIACSIQCAARRRASEQLHDLCISSKGPDCLVPVQLYEGEVEPWLMSDNCTENVPILIRRATFCGAFNADARNFHTYSSFTLSLMLAQVLCD